MTMKNTSNINQFEATRTLKHACVAFWEKANRRIQRTKRTLISEFLGFVDGQEHALRLALNEAEALAWQTGFPHLVFADLAVEKVETLAKWRQHQHIVQRSGTQSLSAS